MLSLFDASGEWSRLYAESLDYTVECVDLSNWGDIMDVVTAGDALEFFESADILLAAPPCTDFSVSGAQYWKQKDRDGRTARSVELVRQVMRLVDLYEPTDEEYLAEFGHLVWAVENPVGRIAKLLPELGTPWYFDPFEFAGYETQPRHLRRLDLIRRKNGEGVTAEEAAFVYRCGAYTKRTGLWGNFTRPTPRPIEPVMVCRQGSPLQRFGGKSDRTKELRSNTPRGFAKAFFLANR